MNHDSEADEADALVRERSAQVRVLQVSAWPGASALALWSAIGAEQEVDHLDQDGEIAVRVRTAHGVSSSTVLRRMHAQSLLQRRTAEYVATTVCDPDAASARGVLIDGEPQELSLWAGPDRSWWLAGDADDLAVVVHGQHGAPIVAHLESVKDVEPLLAGRRMRLGLPRQ